MKWLLFLFVAITITGCTVGSPLAKACHDKVQFYVVSPLYGNGDICYDKRGSLDFMIVNNGEMKIDGFIIEVHGETEVTNITFDIALDRSAGRTINLNLQKSKFGTIKRLEIMPTIYFDNKTNICTGTKEVFRDVGECI